MSDLPLIVLVSLPGVTDASDVDSEVYCVNDTGERFWIAVKSSSFTTVDEDAGTVVEHGSAPGTLDLVPGAWAKIGEVRGWEWDGHVGMEVQLWCASAPEWNRQAYGLKRGSGRYTIAGLGREGVIVPPEVRFRAY
jgi:hypothetical protein